MRVTVKGQVTIPQHIREKLGIHPGTEVDFVPENGKVYVVKREHTAGRTSRFQRYRGIATVKMSTDEIMALTRVDG